MILTTRRDSSLTPRQKFIADLKNPAIKHVQPPLYEINAAAQQMVSFKPLANVSDEEKKIIAFFAVEGMKDHWTDMIGNLEKMRDGNWRMLNTETKMLVPATSLQIEAIFTEWEASLTKAFCNDCPDACKKNPGNSMKSRTLEAIKTENGMDIVAAANAASLAKGGKIIVLDIGCGDGAVLDGIRRERGVNAETHGMSILDETHAPMDFFYHLSAEMMPKGFREKFDLEISHRALEYVALPHLALANITLSLAANGKALLQWSYSQFERMYPHVSASGISGYYNKYLREIISGTKARAQRNGRLVEGELLLKGSISEKQWMIRRALEFSDLDSKQALAYCAELSLINAMPGFRVAIDKYEKTQFGALPVIVTIDRV